MPATYAIITSAVLTHSFTLYLSLISFFFCFSHAFSINLPNNGNQWGGWNRQAESGIFCEWRHEGVNTDQYSSVGQMEERKKGRWINLRKHCSCRDNMNAYCEPPQAFSQFSNGFQTNRTKATVSMCDLSTHYQTISVWVQGLRSVFECEVGVYSGWMTLSSCGALPSCRTTKCHRTNLWVFFTNPVTLWPATQKQVHIVLFDGCPLPFI